MDTRLLTLSIIDTLDTTDLHLTNGYNIDVTPAGDDDCGLICRHSRPYRFYLKSIQEDAYDPYKGVDPVLKTGQMGFLLSKEAGNSMNLLNIAKDAAFVWMIVVIARLLPNLPMVLRTRFWPNTNATVEVIQGTVNIVKGVGSKIFDAIQFAVSIPTASSMVAPKKIQAIATAVTATPAWLSASDYHQSYQHSSIQLALTDGGEGLLRVFVNENLVSQLDQRHVPLASAEPESVYVGELPAGTYRIAFPAGRLRGQRQRCGTNQSGIRTRNAG